MRFLHCSTLVGWSCSNLTRSWKCFNDPVWGHFLTEDGQHTVANHMVSADTLVNDTGRDDVNDCEINVRPCMADLGIRAPRVSITSVAVVS
jgi:hypothetical protein